MRSKWLTSWLMGCASTVPAFAQQATPAEATVAVEDPEAEEEEIVVTGQKPRGSVVGDIAPELTLSRGDVRAYGAATISELLEAIAPQVQSGQGRGGERPVVLLDGRRISGFSEIRNIPPEAIIRVEILPEEVALKYGYRADQKVVNFVLRRRFRAVTAEVEQGIATAGGRGESEADVNVLRITRDGRWNVDAEYKRASALLESERNIGGGDSDFRTLLPRTDAFSLNGTYSTTILNDVSATANASLEGSRSDRRVGLAAGDTIGLRPLARESDSRTGHAGLAFNGTVAPWLWSLTANYDRGVTETETDREGASGPYRDRGKSVSDDGNVELVANRKLGDLPAGAVSTTLKAGFQALGLRSDATRQGLRQRGELSRQIGDVQANIDIPIASRRRDVLAAIGDLSANFNANARRLSDFGTLRTLGGGLNWSPIAEVDVIASFTDEEGAPTMQQLGAPVLTSLNERVYDFTRGETVEVARIEGGNPGLLADSRRVFKLGATVKPLSKTELTLSVNYTSTRIRDAIASFPAITPEIEAAFPDRITRAADGTLLRIDTRAVNFERVDRQELRWGINFSKPLRSARPPGGGNWRERMGGEGRRPAADGRAPDSEARPDRPRADRGEGGWRGGRGGGGRGFGGGGRGGRLQFSFYHRWRLEDTILIREGVPKLDLLGGAAAGSAGGRPRHELQFQSGWFRNGLGARLSANWQSGTRVRGGIGRNGEPTDDLRFSSLATADLRLFANLGEQRSLVSKHRWLRGSRISLEVDNIFNDRVNVRDAAGVTPLNYRPGYLDPMGRTVRLSFRKLFL